MWSASNWSFAYCHGIMAARDWHAQHMGKAINVNVSRKKHLISGVKPFKPWLSMDYGLYESISQTRRCHIIPTSSQHAKISTHTEWHSSQPPSGRQLPWHLRPPPMSVDRERPDAELEFYHCTSIRDLRKPSPNGGAKWSKGGTSQMDMDDMVSWGLANISNWRW